MRKLFDLIFGICSLLGMVATLAIFHKTYKHISQIAKPDEIYNSLTETILFFSYATIALTAVVVCIIFYSGSRISNLKNDLRDLPLENLGLRKEINRYLLLFKNTTESFHSIAHYHRYLILILKDATHNQDLTKNNCEKITYEFEKYILMFLTNIASTLKTITKDDCACCIKIMNEANKIKTFYRDPISYRYRKESDYTQKGDLFIYNVDDNFAFQIIADSKSKATFFACNDLMKNTNYYNNNSDWSKLYNATIVVPIRANMAGDKRDKRFRLLGFLCCDNMVGNYESKEVKDFLAACGDLLYNLLLLYNRLYEITNTKGLKDERLTDYGYWGNS